METAERRRLVVLGCILGVLLAIFAAKTFFAGGGASSGSGRTPKSGADVPIVTSKAKSASAKAKAAAAKQSAAKKAAGARSTPTTTKKATPPKSTPPATFQVFATRNPFEPVIQVETTTPTTTTPTTSGGGGGGGGTAPTTSGGGGSSGGTTTTVPSNEPPPGQTVTLLSVYRDARGTLRAKVQVGSTVYTVGVGTTFANGQYRVVSLDAPCGQFLFGDSPFRLCEGEQTIK